MCARSTGLHQLNAKRANSEVKRAQETTSLQIAVLWKCDVQLFSGRWRPGGPGFGYATAQTYILCYKLAAWLHVAVVQLKPTSRI